MLSIRFPLAIIIGVILCVTSYVVFPLFASAGLQSFAPAIFIILTILLMSVPAWMAQSTSAPQKVKKASPKKSTAPSGTDAASGEFATLYVGNLPYKANEDAIKELFTNIGVVQSVRLMKDRKTGRRKGFGFVEVEANKIDTYIAELNDHEFMDRTIKVRQAKEKQ